MPPEREYEFGGGEKLTFASAKQVRESVKDRAQVFVMLASLEAICNGVVRDLSVVCEFPKVFPEDISDLSPECKMEFSIDLEPGTRLVAMAPYRISASEMSELKKQLEDLLEEKFVRPSVLPWSAPVLLVKKNDGSMKLYTEHQRIVLQTLKDNQL